MLETAQAIAIYHIINIGDFCNFANKTKFLGTASIVLIFVVGTIAPFSFVDAGFWKRADGKLWRLGTVFFERPVQYIPILVVIFGVGLGLLSAYGNKFCVFHYADKPYVIRSAPFDPADQ